MFINYKKLSLQFDEVVILSCFLNSNSSFEYCDRHIAL